MIALIRTLAILLAFAMWTPTVFAQLRVYVIASADDTVGNRLVYAIKERIRRSAAMEYVDRPQDGIIGVEIVTLNPDRAEDSRRTIYSIVWTTKTFHDTPVTMFLTNSVGICGSSRIQECADDLVADTDKQVTKVRTWIQNAVDRSRK